MVLYTRTTRKVWDSDRWWGGGSRRESEKIFFASIQKRKYFHFSFFFYVKKIKLVFFLNNKKKFVTHSNRDGWRWRYEYFILGLWTNIGNLFWWSCCYLFFDLNENVLLYNCFRFLKKENFSTSTFINTVNFFKHIQLVK